MKSTETESPTLSLASNSIKAILILTGWIGFFPALAMAGPDYDYQLYKNSENFGIVVFPKKFIQPDLEQYIQSIGFKPTESGKAVMRYGSQGENQTYMMPLEVQEKHCIKKFIVLQVLTTHDLMTGIYDPEWGLTLPSQIFQMDDIKKNIPKTLNIFRGNNPQRQTLWRLPGNLALAYAGL